MRELQLTGLILAAAGTAMLYSGKQSFKTNAYLKILLPLITVHLLVIVYCGLLDLSSILVCRISSIFILLYGPLILFYERSLIDSNFSLQKVQYLHFIPFVFVLTVYTVFWLRQVNTPFDNSIIQTDYVFILSMQLLIPSLFALAYLLYIFIRYNHHSLLGITGNECIDLSEFFLLRNMLKIFTPAYIITFIIGGIELHYEKNSVYSDLPVLSSFILFFSLFIYSGRRSFKDISKIPVEPASSAVNNNEPEYKKSGLNEQESGSVLEELVSYMETEKPYLDEDFTIHDLSKELGIPRHYITQVINKKLKKNFYTFVNEYRVKEFKIKLTEPGNNHFKLMTIAYESGFKSKSGFYSAFKKIENMTPSEFKEAVLNGN